MASHRRSASTADAAKHGRTAGGLIRGGALTIVPALSTAAAVGVLAHLAASPTTAPAPAASHDVAMQGQVVAVAPDSITTRGSDGNTMTFVVTPATSQLSTTGGFVVDQTVTVLATTTAGAPVATAVAAQNAMGPDGPPMDSDSGI
jgi:hypothetical protein